MTASVSTAIIVVGLAAMEHVAADYVAYDSSD